jgi:hypothetical protein
MGNSSSRRDCTMHKVVVEPVSSPPFQLETSRVKGLTKVSPELLAPALCFACLTPRDSVQMGRPAGGFQANRGGSTNELRRFRPRDSDAVIEVGCLIPPLCLV